MFNSPRERCTHEYNTHDAMTTLKVYDLLGREVATLVNEVQQPGSHEVVWNAGGTASGIYFYQLKAGQFMSTRRMTLVR
jgi:hypothetical protein